MLRQTKQLVLFPATGASMQIWQKTKDEVDDRINPETVKKNYKSVKIQNDGN